MLNICHLKVRKQKNIIKKKLWVTSHLSPPRQHLLHNLPEPTLTSITTYLFVFSLLHHQDGCGKIRMMIWQSGQCLVVSVKRKMDRIVCLSKTSSGQVFTISDKINVSSTNLHQKKGFNKDISASHLYKRLVEETYRKKRVWIHFMETWYWRFTRQKYPVHTNFFMGPDPIFFCSVNRALRMLTAILSGLLIFHAVADPRNSGISAKSREIPPKTRNTAKSARNISEYMSAKHI